MGLPSVATLTKATWSYAALGKIDSPENLADDRIYLFSGKDDSVIDPAVMESLQQYYSLFVDTSNIVAGEELSFFVNDSSLTIVSDYSVAAEHCIPTLSYGEACATLKSPYIGKCSFDGAGAALQTIFNDELVEGTSDVSSNLLSFDQTPFISSTQSSIGLLIIITSPCIDLIWIDDVSRRHGICLCSDRVCVWKDCLRPPHLLSRMQTESRYHR